MQKHVIETSTMVIFISYVMAVNKNLWYQNFLTGEFIGKSTGFLRFSKLVVWVSVLPCYELSIVDALIRALFGLDKPPDQPSQIKENACRVVVTKPQAIKKAQKAQLEHRKTLAWPWLALKDDLIFCSSYNNNFPFYKYHQSSCFDWSQNYDW